MATKRSGAYVWVTWITKLLAGEDSCLWKMWFKANNKYDKVPSDFDLTKWTADHTALLERRADELRADGYTVYIEDQNSFRLEGQNGALLSGKADIVAIRDDDACVIDCKTGKERHSDNLQVLLYMLVLPITVERYRGLVFRGEVQYVSHMVPIDQSGLSADFKTRLKEKMDVAASQDQPLKTPSFSECSWCDITSADCPERVEKATGTASTDLF